MLFTMSTTSAERDLAWLILNLYIKENSYSRIYRYIKSSPIKGVGVVSLYSWNFKLALFCFDYRLRCCSGWEENGLSR